MGADAETTQAAATETSAPSATAAPAAVATPILPGLVAGPDADAVEHQRAVDAREQRTAALRLRAALTVGGVLWPSFLVLDALFAHTYGGGLALAIAVRAVGLAVILGVRRRASVDPAPGPRQLVALDALVFGTAAAGVAILAVPFGGLASPYPAGIVVVLVCRGAFVATRWRDALAPIGVAAASYPVVTAIAAAALPSVRAQIGDPHALSTVALHAALLLSTVAFLIIGGHTVWALRRQVFEARSIGRYRLVKRLGQGGMGEVWQAHHAGLRRDVAIKILRSDRSRQPDALRRFEREVQATAELRHPNTIRIFDYGATDDGLWYYAMEHVDGEDLARRVSRDGPLPVRDAIRIGIQAARALAEAHVHGIVHRDVKPHNILVTQAGGERDFVKVVDFGIARRLDQDGGLTREGWIGGTPSYISPEAAQGRPADTRSDVYGLGAVLHFLVTGEPPAARRAIDPPLGAIVARCLEADPAARYRDAGELADALAATT